MTANQNPSTTPMTFDELVQRAKNGITLIRNPEVVKLMELQVAHALADDRKPLWRGWDVRNAVMIALVRDVAERLPLRAEECRLNWPTERFFDTFEKPRQAGQKGWLEHIQSQVGEQVSKFAAADLSIIAMRFADALTLTSDDRGLLSKAIDNALNLMDVMDPAAGTVFVKMDELRNLRGQMAEKVEACRLAWPNDRFVSVFETPHGAEAKVGWLENVTQKVDRVLETRQPKLEWVERSLEGVERLMTVLRPESPWFCRKCLQVLPDGKFSYCNSCHSKWTADAKVSSKTPQTFRKSKSGYSLTDGGANVTAEELERIVAGMDVAGVELELRNRQPVKSGEPVEESDSDTDEPIVQKSKRVAINSDDLKEDALVGKTERIGRGKRGSSPKKK